eukprot:3244329-Heterocapsa_arctica.AAC.1
MHPTVRSPITPLTAQAVHRLQARAATAPHCPSASTWRWSRLMSVLLPSDHVVAEFALPTCDAIV